MEVNINNWSQIIIEYYTTTITALKNFIAQPVQAGMSEIRDRAQAAPAKSQNFRDNGLPVSG